MLEWTDECISVLECLSWYTILLLFLDSESFCPINFYCCWKCSPDTVPTELRWQHSKHKRQRFTECKEGVWERNSGAKLHSCADFKRWGLQNAIRVNLAARKKKLHITLTVLSVSMCEAYILYPKKEKDTGHGGGTKGHRDRNRESETACAREGQKSIAGIFLSGSQAWE